MRYLSICSGIESATVAWHPLGWEPVAFAEIDPFPCAVLHHHYGSGRPLRMPDPDAPGLDIKERRRRRAAIKGVSYLPETPATNGVPNLGDFTQITRDDLRSDIDLLVGGTPCQDFSVAGLRAGLDGDRGNLSLEFLRLAQRTRPRWLVWENVPGVLSSNGGRDFGAILGGHGRTRVWVRLPSAGRSVHPSGRIRSCRPTATAPCARCRTSWRLATCRRSTF